jgi:regulator of replication initiation timing
MEKRVSKSVTALEGMLGRVVEANSDLRVNLNHISDSLSKVDKISEIGL